MKHAAGNTPKTFRKRFERASKAHFQYISERIRTRSKPKRFRTSSSGQAAFQKHSEQTKRSRYRWRRPSRINRGWHDTPKNSGKRPSRINRGWRFRPPNKRFPSRRFYCVTKRRTISQWVAGCHLGPFCVSPSSSATSGWIPYSWIP